MSVTVSIIKDIQLRPGAFTFHRRTARVVYDSRGTRDKKLHQLIFQQGDRYGEVGDCCDYITHEKLLELERDGFVQINGRISR